MYSFYRKTAKEPILVLSTLLFLLLSTLAEVSAVPHTLPCTGETPTVCGFLPSLSGTPPCSTLCTEGLGFDRCRVCGGPATVQNDILAPLGVATNSRLGGSVANWNGSVALAQHVAQELIPLVNAPIVTWTAMHGTNPLQHEVYTLPVREGTLANSEAAVRPGLGYALQMDALHLVVGSHDSHPRELQLWVRSESTTTAPWSWSWTASDPCPGNRFGYTVAIDARLPIMDDDDGGIRNTVIAGDPGAFFAGRVYVYFTYSPGILQTLYHGAVNNTDLDCFGHSVGADNGLLAVGAPAEDVGAFVDVGAVYVYRWDSNAGLQGEYVFLVKIPSSISADNVGFGVEVAVYDDRVLVGNMYGNTLHYRISGASALLQVLPQPAGINLVTRFGQALSAWGEFFVAGDENWIPHPTPRGASFVWEKTPPSGNSRLLHTLHDSFSSVQTRFGADVDVRGGCIVASGVPNHPPHGGVYLTNLCRDLCIGCDDVMNSCNSLDACGVCAGDNSTCIDCNGVLHGSDVDDLCGVCEGDNDSCVLPYSNPSTILIQCDGSEDVTLRHQLESVKGAATWIVVAPLPTKGNAIITQTTNSLSPLPVLTYTAHNFDTGMDSVTVQATIISTGAVELLVIPVTIGVCIDCNGVIDGPARLDECGVCEGDNSTCTDCSGTPGGGLQLDYCSVCGGNNQSCVQILTEPLHMVDCTSQIIFELFHEPISTPVHWQIIQGPFVGTAYVNLVSGFVIYSNPSHMGYDWFVVRATSMLNNSVVDTQNITLLIDDCVDCNGMQGGTQILDLCGVCGGDGSSCWDCSGTPNGGQVLDLCGVCGGDGSSCLDCAGVPNGGAVLDLCGVCNGINDTCSSGSLHISAAVLIVIGYFLLFLLFLVVAGVIFQWCYIHNVIPSRIRQPTNPRTPPATTWVRPEQAPSLPSQVVRRRNLTVQEEAEQLSSDPGTWRVVQHQNGSSLPGSSLQF